MQNPLSSVGLLFRMNGDPSSFLGTCFAFRHSTHFLTAAHCIGNLSPPDVVVTLRDSTGPHAVEHIFRHPRADLAVLVLTGKVPGTEAFGYFAQTGLGQDFNAYGFPEDVFGDTPEPTARLFKGSIQRFMFHKSYLGYEYTAVEMSIGAPAGLSGGPVFMPNAPWLIIGLVTENLRSTTFLQSVQEIQEGGKVYKETVHEAINYGVALLLESQEDFLHYHVPPLT